MSQTPETIFTNDIPKKLAANPDVARSVGAIYQFNIEGEGGGNWTVDLTKEADWVSAGNADNAGCTITCASEDFLGMYTGATPGPQLFMMGKLRVEGDMGLAMKLGQVIGAG